MSTIATVKISDELVRRATEDTSHAWLIDPHHYIRDVNTHLDALLCWCSGVPSSLDWDVITADRLRRIAA